MRVVLLFCKSKSESYRSWKAKRIIMRIKSFGRTTIKNINVKMRLVQLLLFLGDRSNG